MPRADLNLSACHVLRLDRSPSGSWKRIIEVCFSHNVSAQEISLVDNRHGLRTASEPISNWTVELHIEKNRNSFSQQQEPVMPCASKQERWRCCVSVLCDYNIAIRTMLHLSRYAKVAINMVTAEAKSTLRLDEQIRLCRIGGAHTPCKGGETPPSPSLSEDPSFD